ncbi:MULTISPECIES: RAQPRD family integrative conjugative element protein [Pseudomonas]|uniref:integrative conjugative element protein, RAQPRD family n=1 Tax=Pseudomonas TaxID=286 RepID=UPI0023630DEF|nr:RAQPRD family integrative conjugative element protein [Pseudomonas asplenii]
MPLALKYPYYLLALLGLATSLAQAEPTAHERTRLAGLLRLLDTMTRQVYTDAALPTDEHARFNFDYSQLSADLELIRQGIEHYLSPARAQPRAVPEPSGHYTRAAGETP